MSRRAYVPIAVELPSRKGVTFEVLPAGTFNRVTVHQRTRAGLQRVKSPEIVQRVVKEIERQNKAKDVLSQVHRAEQAAAPKRKAPTPSPPRMRWAALLGLAVFAVLWTVAIRGCMP